MKPMLRRLLPPSVGDAEVDVSLKRSISFQVKYTPFNFDNMSRGLSTIVMSAFNLSSEGV